MTYKQMYICDFCNDELNSNTMISVSFYPTGYGPHYHFCNKNHLIRYIEDNL